MKLRYTLCLLGLLCACVDPCLAASKPNILVILSDDIGYSDIGCFGGEIQTPNLDKLAANGLRFTQFYNTARCCPTRASLLTGLYPHQAAVGHMMEDKGDKFPGYRGDLGRNCLTIAEMLQPASYRNYAVGKWHVTQHTRADGPKHNWPLQRGFHRFYGTIHGAGSFYDPSSLVRDNTMLTAYSDPAYQPKTYYYTDAISEHAVRFLRDHQKEHSDKPFFMYVAYTAAHWPLHALPEDIAKYKGKYDGGYTPIREARLKKLKELGLLDPKWVPAPQVGNWDEVSNKAWEAACMEVYAAMVDRMDQGIGRIIEHLKANGQFENTLIFYLQDNGGCAELTGRQAGKHADLNISRPMKPTFPAMKPTDMQTGSVPKQTRDGYPIRRGPKVMPGPEDTFIAYGRNWANVSNTPFREYKHWVHEGGISTPLIAHWPAGIKSKGELCRQPGHVIDIAATCVDLSGVSYPKQSGDGKSITPLEGRSLALAFRNGTIEREAIYWEHEGNRAIRVGDWKLVAKGPGASWELYDLAKDRTETYDLAAKEPERVKDLRTRWEAYAKRAQVLPWIWDPPYGESKQPKK